MKKICVALTLLVTLVSAVACTGSTEASAPPPVTSTVTTTVTVTSEPVPDAETSAAWKLRRDKIDQLMSSDQYSDKIVLARDENGEISQVYISEGADQYSYLSVFFDGGSTTSIGYKIDGQEYTTWPCEFVSDEAIDCPTNDEERAERFTSTLVQFDRYAKAVFGSKYQV